MNHQRLRYVFPSLAVGLVMLCLSGGSFVPRPAAAAEVEVRDPKSTAEEEKRAEEELKKQGVSDKKIESVKNEFWEWLRRRLPQRAGIWEQEKPELHGHYPCEELHQTAAIEDCKKRREQSR